MADRLSDMIPQWLKSLYHMENALRDAARNGLILRSDKAREHIAEARRHLEAALSEARGETPAGGLTTPPNNDDKV